jgi:predicted TIM-barrel fold metal-dependent hydrolase
MEEPMRKGYKVVDVDTHVTPSFEVLMRYADDALRARSAELAPYVRRTTPEPGRGHPEHEYGVLRINPRPYRRVAGRPEGEEERGGGAGARSALEGRVGNLASAQPSIGVQHDNPSGRLADMDVEGVDIDVIIPGTWACGSTALETSLAKGLYDAYHRYIREYCSADPRRLKSVILAPGADPQFAAATVERLAGEDWVAAVWPLLPEGLPVDDPVLDPIWAVMNEADLPIVHHSFFYEPPYFPGYRDIWGNLAVARTAAHVWGAQRLLAYVLISGMLDRFDRLRVGTIETGHGWLAHWLVRLTSQISYVKGAVPPDLKHTPLEYAQMGRVFCAVEEHEGPVITRGVIDVLGEGVLMYASDYPHPESHFPSSTDNIIAWEPELGASAVRRMMGENAIAYLRLASSPWDDGDARSASGAADRNRAEAAAPAS